MTMTNSSELIGFCLKNIFQLALITNNDELTTEQKNNSLALLLKQAKSNDELMKFNKQHRVKLKKIRFQKLVLKK